MVPAGYSFGDFFEGLSDYKDYINNHKYANNYDYNKAVFLMSDIKFKDNGFLILKPDSTFSTPIGVLNYEEYNDEFFHGFSPDREAPIYPRAGQGSSGLCPEMQEKPSKDKELPGIFVLY